MGRDIIEEALRLLTASGTPLWAIVALALAAAVVAVVGRKVASLPHDPPPTPEPPTEVITEKDPTKVDWDGPDYGSG